MKFAPRLALVLVLLFIAYVGSFFVFHRTHVTGGIREGMDTTSVLWKIEDSSFNRVLVKLYTPLSKLWELPIEWY
jgi:hypothetical protein